MELIPALQLRATETIAFVGGGGKTTLMFRLAAELAARGSTVVTSTTTRLAVHETDLAPHCLACERADDMLARLPAALTRTGHVLAVGCIVREADQVGALPMDTLRRIAALPEVDFLLIEADGSRERPFKAPAAHEPPIPAWTTIVVPVAGLDALGQPLDAGCVHRPEIVAALADCLLGAAIIPAMVAAVLAHPHGGCKNAPISARIIPFLNKADAISRPAWGREIAETLLQTPRIEQVLIGAAATVDPVWECVRRPQPVRPT